MGNLIEGFPKAWKNNIRRATLFKNAKPLVDKLGYIWAKFSEAMLIIS